MKFGIASRLLWSYPLYDVIDIAEKLDFDAVEVWAEHYLRDKGRKTSLAFKNASLIFTLHAFHQDINITSANRRIRRESLKQMFDSAKYAYEIGARTMVVHPGRTSNSKDPHKPYWELQIEALSQVALKTKELGINVCMEVMEPRKKEIVTTPEAANAVFQAVPI